MTDATRAIAIQEAGKLGLKSAAEVVAAAKLYNTFITAENTPSATMIATPAADPAVTKATNKPAPAKAAPAAKATPAAAKKPTPEQIAAAALAAADAEAATPETAETAETAEPEGYTEQSVKDAIGSLLDSGKRTEAIALLKKYGAASASGVKEDKREEFIAECGDIALKG